MWFSQRFWCKFGNMPPVLSGVIMINSEDLWWAAPGEIKKNHVSHCSIWAASQVFFFFFFRWKLCFLCPSGRSWPVQIKKEVVAARPRMVMMLMVLACRKVLHHGSYRIWMNMIDPPKVFWRHIFIFQTGGTGPHPGRHGPGLRWMVILTPSKSSHVAKNRLHS